MSRRLLHYRIERRLGGGSSGEIYLALDEKLHRSVVLKFLSLDLGTDDERHHLIEHEARSLAQLSHPNIAAVHALEVSGKSSFLVMEYIDGETLGHLMALGPLPAGETVTLGIDLAEALAHAHERGVIHRDVKPDNILITVDGKTRLTDFGIAAVHGPRSLAPELEFASATHLSPEQARREPLDGRSDVYSLGIVLYQALAGERPAAWRAGAPQPAPPVPLERVRPDVPTALSSAVMRCLEPSPTARMPSASALARELREVRAALAPGLAGSMGGRARPTHLATWAAATAALLFAVALTAGRFDLGPLGHSLDPELVIVAPLRTDGPGPDKDFVVEAFSESFASSLAQHSRLKVQAVPAARTPHDSDRAAVVHRARLLGAGHLVTCALERESNSYRATLGILETRTRRVLFEATELVPEDRLPMLVSQFSTNATRALGARAAPLHDWFLYSLRSPVVANSPLGLAATEAARGNDVGRMLRTSEDLVRAHPLSPDALLLRAWARLSDDWARGPEDAGKREAFEVSLAALRSVDPGNPWGDALGALRASRDGHLAEAVAGFSSVLTNPALTPSGRAVVLSFRGQAYRDRSDAVAALRDLDEAVALDPTNDYTLAIAADALGTFGKPRDALVRGQQAVAVAPSRPHTQYALAATYGRLGRWREALPHAAEADRLAPSQDYCAFYALTLMRCERPLQAAEEAAKARKRPESPWGQWMLARYDAAIGEDERAMQELERTFELGYADPELARLPEFATLRGTRRFQALWSRMRGRFALASS